MVATVQVVLRETIEPLGHAGDLVRVRQGYARNFLLPRGLAAFATERNIAQIEHERRRALQHAAKRKQEVEAIAAELANVDVEVARAAGEGGKLFGSVTNRDIADALKRKGYEVDRKKLVLPDNTLKELGEYEIGVKLGAAVTGTFTLKVVRQE